MAYWVVHSHAGKTIPQVENEDSDALDRWLLHQAIMAGCNNIYVPVDGRQ